MSLIKTTDNGEVELTSSEEAQVRAEWAADTAKATSDEDTKIVEELLEDERKKAVDALIATKKSTIEAMTKAQRKALAKTRGIR